MKLSRCNVNCNGGKLKSAPAALRAVLLNSNGYRQRSHVAEMRVLFRHRTPRLEASLAEVFYAVLLESFRDRASIVDVLSVISVPLVWGQSGSLWVLRGAFVVIEGRDWPPQFRGATVAQSRQKSDIEGGKGVPV